MGTDDSVTLIATFDQSTASAEAPRLLRASNKSLREDFNVFVLITKGLGRSLASMYSTHSAGGNKSNRNSASSWMYP